MQMPVAAMAKTAGVICKNADVSSPSGRPSADYLLVLLAVGRSGRYNTAADEWASNHTTISRRNRRAGAVDRRPSARARRRRLGAHRPRTRSLVRLPKPSNRRFAR